MKIYHNPRCRKSREALSLIHSRKIDIEIIEYLKRNITIKEIQLILKKLKYSPIDLVRKQEKIWKEEGKNKNLNNKEIIQMMVNNPKIIERPILINGHKAVIGRPPENVLSIID